MVSNIMLPAETLKEEDGIGEWQGIEGALNKQSDVPVAFQQGVHAHDHGAEKWTTWSGCPSPDKRIADHSGIGDQALTGEAVSHLLGLTTFRRRRMRIVPA